MKMPISLNQIKGHMVALRALEIAKTGGHDIVLYGPAGTGKRMLASCYPEVKTQIIQSCPCGNYRSVIRECGCGPKRLERYQERMLRRVQGADMVVEVCHVPYKELESPRSADPERESRMAERIANAGRHTSLEMDEPARRTMEMAARKLALTAGDNSRVMLVARTIANLDRKEVIQARHLAEAVQYSMPMLAQMMKA